MERHLLRVGLGAVLMAACDVVWFALFGHYWKRAMEDISGQALRMRLWAAVPVYLAAGQLLTFAQSATDAFTLGFCSYVVYDFTTLVLFDKYPLTLAVADALWGGVLFTIAHTLVKLALK